MKTSFHWRPSPKVTVLLACLGSLLVPASGRADALKNFTGYTRPGTPREREAVRPAAAEKPAKNRKIIGGSVYFMVLDKTEGEKGDTWGTGISTFDDSFVPGRDARDRSLDTSARYLYLYQVVNDRKDEDEGLVQRSTIRLLVDPSLITSWGHFTFREEKGERGALRGVGFATSFDAQKGGSVIRPVSSNFKVDPAVVYRDPAPYHLAPRPYSFMSFGLADVRAAADPDEQGRAPDAVVLLPMARFDDAPPRPRPARVVPPAQWTAFGTGRPYPGYSGVGLVGWTVPVAPAAPLLPAASVTPVATGSYTADPTRAEEDLDRYPALRAYWNSAPLRRGEKSTIFGFTSNYPPDYDFVRIRGAARPEVVPAAGEPIALGDLRSRGAVPTPIAEAGLEAGATEAGFEGGLGGLGGFGGPGGLGGLGGLPAGVGGGGVSGGGFPGTAGVGTGVPLGTGGFPGAAGIGSTGSGGGGGQGPNTPTTTQTQGQPQNQATNQGQPQNQVQSQPQNQSQALTVPLVFQTPPPGQTPTNVNVNVSNNVQQSQAQAQTQLQLQLQKQKQQQQQNEQENETPPGHVVPAPPAWLLALLGMPFFLVLLRRRSAARGVTA